MIAIRQEALHKSRTILIADHIIILSGLFRTHLTQAHSGTQNFSLHCRGSSLSGFDGCSECKVGTLAIVIAGLLGTEVPAAHLGLFILLVGYSCRLVLLSRRCGHKVR